MLYCICVGSAALADARPEHIRGCGDASVFAGPRLGRAAGRDRAVPERPAQVARTPPAHVRGEQVGRLRLLERRRRRRQQLAGAAAGAGAALELDAGLGGGGCGGAAQLVLEPLDRLRLRCFALRLVEPERIQRLVALQLFQHRMYSTVHYYIHNPDLVLF